MKTEINKIKEIQGITTWLKDTYKSYRKETETIGSLYDSIINMLKILDKQLFTQYLESEMGKLDLEDRYLDICCEQEAKEEREEYQSEYDEPSLRDLGLESYRA